MLKSIVLVLALVSAVHAGLLYTRKSVPFGYTRGGRAAATTHVSFTVALKQRNLDQLESTFWAVSTPGNSQYRQFMKINEIMDIIAPEQDVHDEVMNYFKSAGFAKVHSMRDALDVKTTVAVAEKLFNTKFYTFFKDGQKPIVRAFGEMSLPANIHEHVEFVDGLTTFPIPRYHAKISTPQDAANTIIPQTANILYSIPAQTSAPQTSIGPIEFQGQCYAPSDLQTFAQQVNLNDAVPTTAHTVGPNDPTSPQIEATLDIQYTASVAIGATQWFWLEDGQGWLYQFGTHFFSTSSVPQVVSVSYGWAEDDQCTIDPTECQALGVDSYGYVSRVNTEFQKIGLRGVSILVASGDSGANGRTDPDCSVPQLKPDYPAASPFVTSVGATQLNNAQSGVPNSGSIPACNGQGFVCAASGQEVAVSFDVANFASGGGFSNVATRPSYQDAAVAAYMKSGVQLPPASYYNQTGRGYPDVAALGNAILIYQGGLQQVGGTSASSPIWAGVIAILNQVALKKSNKPLGFLNPLLYQIGAKCSNCFQDITVGDNLCTEDGCSSSCEGYYCAKGWDPVTGWGSPNVKNLIAYLNANL